MVSSGESGSSSTAHSGTTATGLRGTDELTARRIVQTVLAQYQDLVADPERLAAVDRELDAIDLQRKALHAGHTAFAAGDFFTAERELILAYSREYGDSSVYLTALYRRTNNPVMAQGWWTIAQAEGFSQVDLDTVLSAVSADSPAAAPPVAG